MGIETEPPAAPLQPIAYFAQEVTHPLRRAVKFMNWFGLAFGLLGLGLQSSVLRHEDWSNHHILYGPWISLAEFVVSIILLIGALSSLFGKRFGRRWMIVYAYVQLIVLGTYDGLKFGWEWSDWVSSGWEGWLTRASQIVWSIVIGSIYPVLVLVIYRDPVVREYFDHLATEVPESGRQQEQRV